MIAMFKRISVVAVMLYTAFSGFSQDNKLISADELLENFSDYVLLDVRPPEQYEKDHIYQAKNTWRPRYENAAHPYGGMMPTKEHLETLFSVLNIGVNDKVVAYDEKGGCDAARIWWFMQVYGGEGFPASANFKILDGGYAAWGDRNNQVEERPVDTEARPDFEFPAEKNPALFASKKDVEDALNDENAIFVDTRSLREYTGEELKKGAFRKGHIPGAVHIDWEDCLYKETDRTMKAKAELQALFDSKGVTPDKSVITYCHSGVRSAYTTFVLSEILKYPNVKNYDGSWIEWSYYDDLPSELGDPSENIALAGTPAVGYWEAFSSTVKGFANYIWAEITFQTDPWYVNYFWWLIVLSLVVWGLEIAFPWRKEQAIIRKDFWLDAFYMFFNFYIFALFISGFYSIIGVIAFNLGYTTDALAIINVQEMPKWAGLLIFFILNDFVQWFTHVLLHRYDWMWRFHKVHHSVEQMGFAAHLRYHWMENILYKPLKTLVVMLLVGGEPADAFMIHYIAIAIGHLNHANIGLDYGPLKYLINNPKMHIWHHAYALPEDRRHGVNFGISLSLWDYIFKTNYIPDTGRDIKLGFPGLSKFPKTFFGQLIYGFGKGKDEQPSSEN